MLPGSLVERGRTRKFGGARRHFDNAEIEEVVIFLRVGIPSAFKRVATHLLFGEIRTIEVDPSDMRTVRGSPSVAHLDASPDHPFELKGGTRCRCRKDCGGAVAQMRFVRNP